ncbi:MAG: S8 family serine peptidase, partial [Lachnospiraceae bacterium]|nr:S8 family serine peptidase [Lachnospiraceae bacterium]
QAQYDDIRLAYSLARGFTGRGTTIAVLDSGSDYWHGAAVSAIAGGAVAPNAVVESYQVTTNGPDFMSYAQIGDIIAGATNANVYNASWNASMQATQIHSRTELIRQTDENFINQVSIAATGRDAIFVFAAGNDGNAQSGALSAMPRVMNELNGHFINVVAYDSAADQIAWYSNACGVTQNYCITAPGSDIDTGHEIVNGTSFAAPIVSAAVAVLREAYPYMTATQITSLLFETARDIGAPGIDPVYGHGMLDMERATRPVGAALVPIGDTMQPIRTARVAAPIAHNIKSAGVKLAFFDAYGRPFQANLADNIKSYNPGRGFDFLRAANRDKKMSFGPIEMGFSPKDFVIGDGMLKLKQDSAIGFIGTHGNLQRGKFNFHGATRLSMLRPHTVDESMISDITTVYIASAETSVQYNDFSFGVAIPDVIVRGDMQITTPIGRNRQGDILYTQNSVSLTSRPALEYTASYKYLTAGFVDNPYGTDEIFIVAKTRVKF